MTTYAYEHSVPSTQVTGLTTNVLPLTNLIPVGSPTVAETKTQTTYETVYTVAAGDQALPARIIVKNTVRKPSATQPNGSSSYAARVEFLLRLSDTDLTDNQELWVGPADMTISWNIPGMSIMDLASMKILLAALGSLPLGAIVANAQGLERITELAYHSTAIFS